MSTAEDWARNGFTEKDGKLERINDANRPLRSGDNANQNRVGTEEAASAENHPAKEQCSDNGAPRELSHTELQEFEAMDNEAAEREAVEKAAADYLPGISRLDGESRPKFRITVIFHVSDRRRRDPTGAFETICDLVTATVRRLNERLAGRFVEKKQRGAGRRRSNHHHRTVAVKGPVPF